MANGLRRVQYRSDFVAPTVYDTVYYAEMDDEVAYMRIMAAIITLTDNSTVRISEPILTDWGVTFKMIDESAAEGWRYGESWDEGTVYMTDIKALSLPKGTVFMDGYDSVFSGCRSLNYIELPSDLTTIGENMFSNCISLTKIEFPDSIETVGEFAFEYCDSLSEMVLPQNITYIDRGILRNCSGLTSVTIPSSVTGVYIASYSEEEYAPFYGCDNLTTVVLAEGTESIANGLFDSCSAVESIDIPGTVTTIPSNAFNECKNLSSLTLHEGTQVIGDAIVDTEIILTIPDSVTSIGVFRDTKIKGMILGDGLTSLPEYMLANLSNLEYFELGDNVREIPGHFMASDGFCPPYYPKITDLDIPSSITSIGTEAFFRNTNLSGITLHNGLQSINEDAFNGCVNLKSINIPNTVMHIGRSAFMNCGLSTIEIPSNITVLDSTFYECYNLTNVTLNEGLKEIGPDCFKECSGLRTINIPNSVTYIGHLAFYQSGLNSIVISSGVTNIESTAFESCMSLSLVTVSDSVTRVGLDAFKGTAWYNNQPDGPVYVGLIFYKQKGEVSPGTSIVIREGTKGISQEAIYHNANVTSISIPSSVTHIENSCIYYCSGITSITVNSNNPRYDSRNNCNAIIETSTNTLVVGCLGTTIPNSITKIGANAFYGSDITSIEIPSGVTELEERCFSSCYQIRDVILHEGLQKIGSGAFYETLIESITIPDTVTEIGYNAFYGCDDLRKIYYHGSATGFPWGARYATLNPEDD